jgi:hypothetical protein
MPQNIRNSQLLDPAAPMPKRSPAGSPPVDIFADRLMDDLFADVEGLLNGSIMPVAVPVPPALPKPQLDVTTLPRVQELLAPPMPQWNSPEENLSVPEINELVQSRKPAQPSNLLQKTLLLALVASALTAVGIWATHRGVFSRILGSTAAPTVATAPQVQQPSPFAEYMQRSLELIDRKATGKSSLPPAPFNSSLPALPSKATPLKTPVVINLPPVPQSPVPAAAAPVPPTVTASDPARRELNQLLTRLSAVLEKLYPALNRPQVAQPLPVVKTNLNVEPARSVRGVAIASDPTQSAVLIETNGITQRFYMGESIGSSGWSVVDISSNYISLRKNGEVRAIAVGESFK